MPVQVSQVFVNEQGFTAEQEDDGLDKDCFHLLALSDEGTPIGTLRCFTNPKIRIGRLAVLKAARGTGTGKALMHTCETIITRTLGQDSEISLSSQIQALPFYQSLGYQSYGEQYLDDGQQHIAMKKLST